VSILGDTTLLLEFSNGTRFTGVFPVSHGASFQIILGYPHLRDIASSLGMSFGLSATLSPPPSDALAYPSENLVVRPRSLAFVKVQVPPHQAELLPLSVSSGLRLAPITFHLPPVLASVGKTVFLTPPEPSHAYVPILNLDFVSHRLRPTQAVGLVHDLRDNQAVQAFEFTGVSEADDTLTDLDETTTPSPDETATTAAIATALKVKLQHLPTSQQTAMLQVFSKHLSVFFEPAQPARVPPVAIPTRHSQPLHSAPYRLAPPMQKVLKELLDPMIRNGIVKPTISDITSPVVLAKKKMECIVSAYTFADSILDW